MRNLEVKRRIVLTSPCFGLKFCPTAPEKLCVTTEDGEIMIFDVFDPPAEDQLALAAMYPRQLSNCVNSMRERTEARDYRVITPRAKWVGHYNSIFDIDYVSGQDNQIITASGDITCALWDLEKQKLLKHLIGHKKSVRCVRSMPGNQSVFASGGRDGKLLIYDSRTNSGKAVLQNQRTAELLLRPVDDSLFAEGGFMLDGRGNSTQAATPSQGKRPRSAFTSKNAVTCMCFVDQKYVITGEANEDQLKVWDLRMMQEHSRTHFFDVEQQCFVPRNESATKPRSKHKRKCYRARAPEGQFFSQKFSFYSAEVLHYQKIREHFVFDSQHSGTLRGNMSEDELYEETSVFIPEGSSVSGTGGNESSYRPRDICERLQKSIHDKASSNIKGYSSIFINPARDQLLVNSINSTLYLFNVNGIDLAPPQSFTGHKSTYYVKACMSPCGEFVVSGNQKGTVCLWETRGKDKSATEFAFHSSEVNCVDWSSASSHCVATSSDDCTVLVLG